MNVTTTIKSHCPVCGPVTLTADDVRLVIPPGRTAWFAFACPGCGDRIHHTASPAHVALLGTGGVHPERVPAEVWEAHAGPRITYDDVLDLHQALHPTNPEVSA